MDSSQDSTEICPGCQGLREPFLLALFITETSSETQLLPEGFWELFPGDTSLGGDESRDGQRGKPTHNKMAPEAFVEPTENS